jgi:hypothetical protein
MAELKTRLVIRNDSTGNWNAAVTDAGDAGVVLLKGELGIEFTADNKTKIKVGDGVTKWEALPYFGSEEAKTFQVGALSEITETDLAVGDTAIVKTAIYVDEANENNNKYSYTGYVYNGSAWTAMDGNYNAENVYFDEDMLFTYAFGKYKLSNGNVTIPSAGKNLKELLMSAHVDIINPSSTAPGFSIDASANKSGEVGTAYTLPTATATFTDGKYTYGYVTADGTKVNGTNTAAGITASTINVTCDKSSDVKNATNTNSATLSLTTANLNDGISKDLLFEDTAITYKFTATCTYPASTRTPTNNVGETSNADAGVAYSPISGGGWSTDKNTQKTDSCTVTGWRKMFMGTVDSANTNTEINSALIRSTMNKLVNAQVSTSAQTFTVPVGATKIIVACPVGYVISKCEYFTMSWEEVALFPHVKDAEGKDKMVQVADARGGTNGLKDYHVYTFTHASPTGFEAATQYRVTLKQG